MWECRVSVDIVRPVEEVFSRLSDLSRHCEFSDGLTRVEQTTPGAPAVGRRFSAEETVPARYVSYSEITALEEPRLIAWKAWVPRVMRTEWEFRLTPHDGGTNLVQTSRWAAAGPIGLMMLSLHRRRNVPKENRRTLARIKEVLESEAVAIVPPRKDRATASVRAEVTR